MPGPVLGELDRLVARGEGGAVLARTLAGRFPTVPGRGRGDSGVLDAARRLGAAVVTADERFQARLVAAGVPVLVPRDRTRLELRAG
ncbi:nucleotide-binding protein PInc, partial [mine drainage metagenome]